MKKQTKIVAVASAAAMLAIGASMTSFAATGWVEEDGQWYYYDKDGNRVEDEWKKSGDNWYWLDSEENGAMATDKLVEDDNDTYFVDANGVMVKNTWVKVVNEDQDEDSDPAEYRYYYMQNSGKAYKASDNSTKVNFKTIDGKKYAFDEDGKMLYGWINKNDASLKTDDSDWEEADYYLGSWEEGWLKTGWQKITVYDDKDGKDDDYDYWFNFKSNGEKRANTNKDQTILEKKINGKKYGFDNRGVMVYTWTVASTSTATQSSASSWKYFNSPEDGARVTKGWFKVVAPTLNDTENTFKEYNNGFATSDANDESERWYYANDDGNLASGEIKKIKGKYYGFRPDDGEKGAAMLTGLCILQVDEEGKITDVIDDDISAEDLDDILDGNYKDQGKWADGVSLYYFGNNEDSDGALKTGSTTVSLDGSSYNFYFSKTGGAEGKGKGVTGTDDMKYIYMYGCRVKADSDDKYQLVKITANTEDSIDINADGVTVEKIDSANFRKSASEEYEGITGTYTNDDKETVSYSTLDGGDYYLVNSSGNVQKNKTAAKDGNDWYFYVSDYKAKLYTNNKTLKSKDEILKVWDEEKHKFAEDLVKVTDWKQLISESGNKIKK